MHETPELRWSLVARVVGEIPAGEWPAAVDRGLDVLRQRNALLAHAYEERCREARGAQDVALAVDRLEPVIVMAIYDALHEGGASGKARRGRRGARQALYVSGWHEHYEPRYRKGTEVRSFLGSAGWYRRPIDGSAQQELIEEVGLQRARCLMGTFVAVCDYVASLGEEYRGWLVTPTGAALSLTGAAIQIGCPIEEARFEAERIGQLVRIGWLVWRPADTLPRQPGLSRAVRTECAPKKQISRQADKQQQRSPPNPQRSAPTVPRARGSAAAAAVAQAIEGFGVGPPTSGQLAATLPELAALFGDFGERAVVDAIRLALAGDLAAPGGVKVCNLRQRGDQAALTVRANRQARRAEATARQAAADREAALRAWHERRAVWMRERFEASPAETQREIVEAAIARAKVHAVREALADPQRRWRNIASVTMHEAIEATLGEFPEPRPLDRAS